MLMALHLGFHTHSILAKIEKKLKTTSFEYTMYFVEMILLLTGIYIFSKSRLWGDMILDTQSIVPMQPLQFYIAYISIIVSVCIVVHFTLSAIIILQCKRREDEA
jgi:hypothetical protein